jgi:hypothetical protein
LNRVGYIQGADTTSLREELRADRERLEQVKTEGTERRAEAETRLHTIEAAASRGANWAETSIALNRLSTTQEQIPLALEAARMEQQALEESEKALREVSQQTSTKELGIDGRGEAH